MSTQVLLLILSQLSIRPIRALNVLDSFEEGGTGHIHFLKDGILYERGEYNDD